jgi:hypothetical protein
VSHLRLGISGEIQTNFLNVDRIKRRRRKFIEEIECRGKDMLLSGAEYIIIFNRDMFGQARSTQMVSFAPFTLIDRERRFGDPCQE